jgi:hypothetical protein
VCAENSLSSRGGHVLKQIPITFPFLELSRNEGLRIISFIDLSACKPQAGQPEVKKNFDDAKRAAHDI